MDIRGKRVLVTGGAGFIGSHLVDRLLDLDCEVRVFDNLTRGVQRNLAHHLDNPKFSFAVGNILDPFDVSDVLDGIDVVFHLSGLGARHCISHPLENHRVNTEGTLIILQESLKHDVERFLFCGTAVSYGDAINLPISELHPSRPNTIYGSSKLAGEGYTRSYHVCYGLPTTSVRLFNIYGPRTQYEGKTEFIPSAIGKALQGEKIIVHGDGSQGRDFTYVDDVVSGLLAVATTDAAIGQFFNIGSGKETSIRTLGEKILEIIKNPKAEIEYVTDLSHQLKQHYADTNLIKSVTGWEPKVSLDEGLQRTVDWLSDLLQTIRVRN